MSKFYIPIIIIVVFVVFFQFIAKNFPQIESKNKLLYKYKRKNFLITAPEHKLFDILVEILGNQYHVFTQVHLPTIFEHKIKGQSWKGAFSHINQKSVDFVICDKAYIKPLLAIELDDRTHEREDRKERDEEVEQIFQEAGMPLLRIPNTENFNKEEIKRLVLEKLN